MTRNKVVLFHLTAWAIYIFLYSTLWRDDDRTLGQAIVIQLWLLPPKLFLVYTAILILIPRFFLRGRYFSFFALLVIASLLGGIFNQAIIHFFLGPHERFWDISLMSKRLTFINSTLLFALTAEGIRMWYEAKEANARLVKEKMATELSLLRSQLQPHFFFNTMNNLYSLVLQKSDLAPSLVLQMSDLMRYIISSSRLDRVPLIEEVNFIRDYIGIEKIRYTSKVRVETEWPENMDSIEIPPLTLFPFVENAFKHGVAEEVSSAWISVSLILNEQTLIYKVRNSYPSGRVLNGAQIGLQNTKERLKIAYGNEASVETKSHDSIFEAMLSIKTLKK